MCRSSGRQMALVAMCSPPKIKVIVILPKTKSKITPNLIFHKKSFMLANKCKAARFGTSWNTKLNTNNQAESAVMIAQLCKLYLTIVSTRTSSFNSQVFSGFSQGNQLSATTLSSSRRSSTMQIARAKTGFTRGRSSSSSRNTCFLKEKYWVNAWSWTRSTSTSSSTLKRSLSSRHINSPKYWWWRITRTTFSSSSKWWGS